MTSEEMRNEKKMRRSSESPSSPRSFSSLPHDVALNCLARISRSYHPILSQVSNSRRSLLVSPDLEAARSLRGETEKCLYVCLNLNNNNPSWFVLSPAPKQRLIPIPFPDQHPSSSTVVSVGSEIYLIGGFIKGKKRTGRRVFLLDCNSAKWRQLPKMRVSRQDATVNVIDGKIYVIGGCSNKYYDQTLNYGEAYDPKTQTWESTGMRGQIYFNKMASGLCSTVCLLELENGSWCRVKVSEKGKLVLVCQLVRDDPFASSYKVSGLKKLSSNYLIAVTNPGQGRRVIVWWKTYTKECKTEIWCAQILIECHRVRKFRGFVKWAENVLTFQGCESDDPNFLLHSALV